MCFLQGIINFTPDNYSKIFIGHLFQFVMEDREWGFIH